MEPTLYNVEVWEHYFDMSHSVLIAVFLCGVDARSFAKSLCNSYMTYIVRDRGLDTIYLY